MSSIIFLSNLTGGVMPRTVFFLGIQQKLKEREAFSDDEKIGTTASISYGVILANRSKAFTFYFSFAIF